MKHHLCESSPDSSLIPEQTPLRYQALAMAQDIAMEIHPLEQPARVAAFGARIHRKAALRQKWIGLPLMSQRSVL